MQSFRCPECKTGCFLQVAHAVAEKLMEGESQQLARLLGRLEHPGCSLNILKVMAPCFYLALPRGVWVFALELEVWGRGNCGLSNDSHLPGVSY